MQVPEPGRKLRSGLRRIVRREQDVEIVIAQVGGEVVARDAFDPPPGLPVEDGRAEHLDERKGGAAGFAPICISTEMMSSSTE